MTTQRPGRPFGLSLAILVSVFLFSLLPLAQMAMYFLLQRRLQTTTFLDGGGAVGGSLSDLPGNAVILQSVLGVAFLVIGVLAWRGKPAAMRFVLAAAVIGLTALTITLTLLSLGSSPNLQSGLDSAADLVNSLLRARLMITVLVALYVIWYINRGPARAFFRGYYLPSQSDSEQVPSP